MPPDASAYPPERHMLRDLRLAIDRQDGPLRVELPVVPELLDRGGAVRAGALAVAIDVFGGTLALDAVRPDWAVTSELTVHRLAGVREGPVVVTGEALRAGRTHTVIEVSLRGGEGPPHAVGAMTFTRIPRRGDAPPPPFEVPRRTEFAGPDSGLAAPLPEALGARAIDAAAGRLELPLAPEVRNSLGALQGGAVVALADAAADALLAAEAPEAAVTDLSVRFLALGRAGPIRTEARVLRRAGPTRLVRVALRDAGEAGRLAAIATVTAGPLP